MKDQDSKEIRKIAATYCWLLVPHTGGIALQYRKPWLIHFGIPAICILAATLLLLSGSCSSKSKGPQGSPVTTVARVFAASASNISQRCPENALVSSMRGMALIYQSSPTPKDAGALTRLQLYFQTKLKNNKRSIDGGFAELQKSNKQKWLFA